MAQLLLGCQSTARWSKQSSWELCLFNINSCVTEAEAGTAGGKTLLQGEAPSMQVRKNLKVLLAPQQ